MTPLRPGLVLVALGAFCVLAQQSSAQQAPTRTPGVIQINVDLVQVDAVVTDEKGNPVTDLKAEDFEVLQDGRPQRIRNFEFVRVRETRAAAIAQAAAPAAPVTPTMALRPEQVRRTIALVVDDMGLSFDSTVRARDALKKWVANEMQPGDLVSVVRTHAAMGAMQQFTNDKRLLYSAIDRIKYQPGRIGVESFSPLSSAGPSVFDRELSNVYLEGSLNAVRYIIAGLRELPGRKSVILFAEDMSVTTLDRQQKGIEDRLRQLADEANRSSVVIHTIDARGVAYTGPTAADGFFGDGAAAMNAISTRASNYNSSQDGMVLLAQRTGGTFAVNNDFAGSVRQAIDDGDGYYLMGYQPALGTFDPPSGARPRFHSISVRVTRPGLKVRSRTGFYGAPDSNFTSPPRQTRTGQLAKALVSPFTTADLRVRLTALVAQSDKEEIYLRTMLHFDARDIAFNVLPDGTRTAQIDIAMVTIDSNGDTKDAIDKTWKITVQKESFETVLKQGLVYSVSLPIKKAGPYHLRVALRDATAMKVGSAMQFVEIPDVKSGKLALSGIVVSREQHSEDSPEGSPAVRVFEGGSAFSYAFEVFNTRRTAKENPPQLEMQTRLYRENELVFESPAQHLQTETMKDAKRLAVGGKMQLTRIPPGEYVMHVSILDRVRGNKARVAVQSIDFEIRP
jgi:VWFA-related protein